MGSELQWMGDAAWRFAIPEGTDPAAALEVLRALPRVLDAVVAESTALVRFDPANPPDDPRPALVGLQPLPEQRRRLHVVTLRYDGADLEEVARIAGLTRSEVIARRVVLRLDRMVLLKNARRNGLLIIRWHYKADEGASGQRGSGDDTAGQVCPKIAF